MKQHSRPVHPLRVCLLAFVLLWQSVLFSVLTTILHNGTQMCSAYDDLGQMRASWTLDKDGSTLGWKKLSYNDRGEMDAVIQSTKGIPADDGSGANDLVTSFTYDELGRKLTQTDAKKQTTRMGYDIRGRMQWRRLPDGKTETMEYDALGQLREKTDFRGYTTTFDYDVRGRMKSKTPDARLTGEESVFYSYNGENYREAKRGALVTSYTSDADRGWLTMVIGPQGTVKYDYSDFGERTGVAAAGGTTTYTYDELGRMDTVSDKATGASESKLLAKYRYDAVGNLDSTVTSNGALPVSTSRYGYDALNRLDVMTHRRGLQKDGALLSSYDYDVRADGKRKGYDEIVANDQTAATPRVSSRTVAFAYDDAGRLVKEESRDGDGVAYELNWALDKVGNRTFETRLKAKDATSTNWVGGSLTRVVSGYSSTGTDWLTATTVTRGVANAAGDAFVGATTATQTGYGYDSNGSQIRKTTESADASNSEGMEWSFEGALLRVEKGENNATKFTYDASGNRVQALTRDGAKMSAANYLVDENTAYAQVLEERDSSGELQARYVYGQGYGPILLQRRQKNSADVEEVRTRYLLADGHGSVRQLVTASGTVTDSYFYDAWGGGLSGGSGSTVNPYRYNGQQTDEATGGYYLRARYYQPGQGRFLGHDPMLGSGSDPASLHRYLYAGGDGVNFVDPSGRMTWTTTVLISAIGIAAVIGTFQGIKLYRDNVFYTAHKLSNLNASQERDIQSVRNRIRTAEAIQNKRINTGSLEEICSPLFRYQLKFAQDGTDLAPGSIAFASRTVTSTPYMAFTRKFFELDDSGAISREEKLARVAIHECLHHLTELKGVPRTDPVHARVYGWSKFLASQLYGSTSGGETTKSPYIPNNLKEVIEDNAAPNPNPQSFDLVESVNTWAPYTTGESFLPADLDH